MAVSTGTAILGAAGIAGGTSILGSIMGGNAASDAAAASANASTKAVELQLEYLRETRADIAEAVEKGLIDLDTGFNMAISQMGSLTDLTEYNAYKGLLADPSSVMNRATNKYQYQQGLEALQAAFSKSGGLSGISMKSATEYGQNFAAQALDEELNRLLPMINISTGAIQNVANLYSNLGSSKANLRVGGATSTANLTGSTIANVANTIQNQGAINASSMINEANLQNSLFSNLAGLATNSALAYALLS
jgi:hypothetical protein